MPWIRAAAAMFSLTTRWMPHAAAITSRPSGLATCSSIARRPRGGDGAGGRARFHQADRKSSRLAWQHDAAGRLHDVELAGDVELREPSLEVFQVTRH